LYAAIKSRLRVARGLVLGLMAVGLYTLIVLACAWSFPKYLIARNQAQTAADAAVGAVAQQAMPVLTMNLAYRDPDCAVYPGGPAACTGGATQHTLVKMQGFAFETPAWWTSGWRAESACTLPGHVCESWSRVGDLSWTYTDQGPGDPYGTMEKVTAQQYLEKGMGSLSYRIDAFSTATDGSGKASLRVTVTSMPGESLRALLHLPATLVVTAKAEPRMAVDVPVSVGT
jgi:hypothetical protein